MDTNAIWQLMFLASAAVYWPSGFPSLLSELHGRYLAALAAGGSGVQDGRAGAFGPCMFTGAGVYREMGGHEAIRGDVVDDLALAGLYRKAGYPVRVFLGDRRFSFRMYPGGVRQLIGGWTKNMASGAGGAGGPVILLLVLWVTGMVNAACALVFALAVPWGPWPAAAALLLYFAWAGQLFHVSGKAGNFGPAAALLFPLHLLFFTAVFFRSLFSTFVRGSVGWRGRQIDVGRRLRR